MAHTHTSLLYHCVFSTKGREKTLPSELRKRLWAYINRIAQKCDIKLLAVGGTADHVHLFLSLPATTSLAKAMQHLKAVSSKWVSETFPNQRHFAWQAGYSAFSVGASQKKSTIAYIEDQEEHHRHKTFQEEYCEFLERHEIEYDERYLWG